MKKGLIVIIAVLLVFGLAVLSSAGIVDGQRKFGSSYFYLKEQVLSGLLPGLVMMFILSKIDYKIWKKLALPILFGALALMILVFIPQFGIGLKGASRWVNIYGFTFQPSEILKLAVVIYLAAWFGNRDSRMKNWTYGLAPFIIVLGFVGVLLRLQPDMGTLGVTIMIAGAMYFFAGFDLKRLAVVGGIVLALGTIGIIMEPYQFNRVKAMFNPDVDPRGISYQQNQAKIAIGAGGMFGVGYGKSTQKFGFLPETVNDSIFAIIVEELGFVGGIFTVSLYLILAFIMVRLARTISDKFGQLFILGVCVWIVGQAFINIFAISGLMPLTGVPLPLISFGGTAMVTVLAAMGIVLNIAKKS
jgi:cell division protein FtsW